MGPKSIKIGVLIKKGSLETALHMVRTPCKDEGRDPDDASANQGTLKIASKPPEASKEAWNTSFCISFRMSTALPTAGF